MESKEKMELIQLALQQLMEERRGKKEKKSSNSSSEESTDFVIAEDSDDNYLQLSNLISQLETLKEEQLLTASKNKAEAEAEAEKNGIDEDRGGDSEAGNNSIDEDGGGGRGGERIVKALEEIKRQNFITHCLVSAMIVLTLVWQFSEVSLVLKVRNGISHPFRCVGTMLRGMLKGPNLNVQNGHKQNSTDQQENEGPGLVIPEVPHLGFDRNED